MTPAEARGILGLSAGAGIEEVQKAYKKRSQFMHPDRFAGRPEGEIRFATAEFQRLSKARDLLRDSLSNGPRSPFNHTDEPDRECNERSKPSGDVSPTHVTVTISGSQAAAGNIILVRTPVGREVSVRLPHSLQSSTTIRARGRGDGIGPEGVRNDLLVTVHLAPQEDASRHFRDDGHFSEPEGSSLAEEIARALSGRAARFFLYIAAALVLVIILIGLMAVREDNTILPGDSIAYVAESTVDARCSPEMSECWVWKVKPRDSCSSAKVSIMLSESQDAPGGQRITARAEGLIAGQVAPLIVSRDRFDRDYAAITSITCDAP